MSEAKFSTFLFSGECAQKDPVTIFQKNEGPNIPNEPYDITSSTINNTKDSAEFYYLIKKITVNVDMLILVGGFDEAPTLQPFSSSTVIEAPEPYKKSCEIEWEETRSSSPSPAEGLFGSVVFPFFLAGDLQKILLHLEIQLNLPVPLDIAFTPNVVGFFLTTFDRDFGFTFTGSSGAINYFDTTIPVNFTNPNTGKTYSFFVKLVEADGGYVLEGASIELEFY
jgi:hypothetical protein